MFLPQRSAKFFNSVPLKNSLFYYLPHQESLFRWVWWFATCRVCSTIKLIFNWNQQLFRGYALMAFSHRNTSPSVGLNGKTFSNLATFSRGSGETTGYLLKIMAVGLDSNPYDLSMNQWSMDIAVFLTLIYVPYSNTWEIHKTKPEGIQKPCRLIVLWAGFVGKIKMTRTVCKKMYLISCWIYLYSQWHNSSFPFVVFWRCLSWAPASLLTRDFRALWCHVHTLCKCGVMIWCVWYQENWLLTVTKNNLCIKCLWCQM